MTEGWLTKFNFSLGLNEARDESQEDLDNISIYNRNNFWLNGLSLQCRRWFHSGKYERKPSKLSL